MKIYSPEFNSTTGYGRVAAAARRALGATRANADRADLAVCNPSECASGRFRMTAWETDALPPSYRGWNVADVIIVHCEHNRTLFRKYTDKPIEVLPEFMDTNFEHLPPARPFRFICVARDNGVNERKGIDSLIAWFTEAFPCELDVALTIKMSPHCKRRASFDRRITFIHEDLPRAQYLNLLASHHCGVFLSGMEAWNLPLCELMGMGRPSLCIPVGGPADFTTPETSWHLDYKMVKAPQAVYLGVGKVAAPLKTSTIQAMRSAYEDQFLVAEKGLNAAKAALDYTEERFAMRLRDIIKRYE